MAASRPPEHAAEASVCIQSSRREKGGGAEVLAGVLAAQLEAGAGAVDAGGEQGSAGTLPCEIAREQMQDVLEQKTS